MKNVNFKELDKLYKETITFDSYTLALPLSMHQILAHSAALIDANKSTDLGVGMDDGAGLPAELPKLD